MAHKVVLELRPLLEPALSTRDPAPPHYARVPPVPARSKAVPPRVVTNLYGGYDRNSALLSLSGQHRDRP